MTPSINNNLSDWLGYIERTHSQTIDMGLERVRHVFDAMQLERKAKQIVVVSGTNGKGSTIAMVEACLLSLGVSVGSYTSPHIENYNERVKINGNPVSDEQLVKSFESVELARRRTPLTYFEFGTLAAFDVLFQQDLDVLLLEIGLGGRLDAVNIIDSDLSIITSVDLDHTDWLGNSIAEIGAEKAGILRRGILAILGEALPQSVFDIASDIDAPVSLIHRNFGRTQSEIFLDDSGDVNRYGAFPNSLLPENNILLALQAIKVICTRLENSKAEPLFNLDRIIESIENLTVPGRLENVKGVENVYLDVGHNPHAAVYLCSFLNAQRRRGKTIHAVYSSLADKDPDGVASILSPVVDCWYIAPLSDSRALDLKTLETAVGKQAKNMLSFASVPEALDASLRDSADEAVLTLVFGSFYVIEAAKVYFENL